MLLTPSCWLGQRRAGTQCRLGHAHNKGSPLAADWGVHTAGAPLWQSAGQIGSACTSPTFFLLPLPTHCNLWSWGASPCGRFISCAFYRYCLGVGGGGFSLERGYTYVCPGRQCGLASAEMTLGQTQNVWGQTPALSLPGPGTSLTPCLSGLTCETEIRTVASTSKGG